MKNLTPLIHPSALYPLPLPDFLKIHPQEYVRLTYSVVKKCHRVG